MTPPKPRESWLMALPYQYHLTDGHLAWLHLASFV